LPHGRLFGILLTWFWLLFIALFLNDLRADSLYNRYTIQPDSLVISADTLISENTPDPDTTIFQSNRQDTGVIQPVIDRSTIEALISRVATDSIVQDMAERKVYLYGNSEIKYQDITLKAKYIEIDFKTNTVLARGMEDSTGKIVGNPVFSEGDQTFKAKEISYNFITRKGMVLHVLTEDDQGFLHGERVKKMDDNTVNVLHGYYTTCNLEENPHFGFRFKKARVIPDNKIVTGPAYMEIEGVPTILALPFGIFPNNKGKKSGIVIPSYGESANRGFFLENGGYYWAINDYMDFQVLGDIYSRGSWNIKPRFRYSKRYKYSGGITLGFGDIVLGTKESPDYVKDRSFRIQWSHRQDPKARPRSSFQASVNIMTSNYQRFNPSSTQDYLKNEFQSSVSYQTNWAGKYFLTISSNYRQNTKTHAVNLSLPELTFTVNRFYPLRRSGGKKRFYEDLAINYTMNAKNTVSTFDTLLFEPGTLERDMKNGAIHKIPISLPLRVLKHFTLSNSINITDRMYSRSVRQHYLADTVYDGNDTILPGLKTDTINGFSNSFDFSISTSLSTKLYGIVRYKKGPLRAIRHVFTPSVGFSYTPDFSDPFWGNYGTYIDADGNEVKYSYYNNPQFNSIYGGPPGRKSGAITFSLDNNLEIKVRSRKDTITGMKKIVLIDNFTISGSYDFARDSMNLSTINVRGRTRIWKNLSVNYASVWDPYMADASGRRINKFEWVANNRLVRMKSTLWGLSFSYKLGDKDIKKKEKPKEATENEWTEIEKNPDDYVDWNIPWSLSFNYTFQYRLAESYVTGERTVVSKVTQTLGFNGQINITPKWKFTLTSGWDFNTNKLSYTSINVYRDLHCWEMRFSWIPLGIQKSWNFSINVKASILQDLKLNRKSDWRDNL